MTQQTASAQSDDATTGRPIMAAPADLAIGPESAELANRLRAFLVQAGYTADAVKARTGDVVFDEHVPAALPDFAIEDAVDALVALFIHARPVASALLRSLLPDGMLDVLDRLGLVHVDSNGECTARLALYPVATVIIVSDHPATLMGDPPADVVYPALADTSIEFFEALPDTPCESLLDLGAGTGIAAIRAATTYARHAWAVDITARSTRMAGFNAALNGVNNITVLEGDLYKPVAGLRFDRIVSHPPYMPEDRTRLLFRDGGEDGEHITRGVVTGLADHLLPGGRFQCRCMGTDRKDEPFELRLRRMLGSAEAEFDIGVLAHVTMNAAAFFGQILARRGMTAAAYEEQRARFERLRIENMVVCTVSMVRHDAERQPVTVRRQLSPRATPSAAILDWMLGVEQEMARPDGAARLMAARPRLSPRAEVRLAHRMHEGTMRAHACTTVCLFPISFSFDSSPGLMLLLGRSDGSRSVAELYAEMLKMRVFAEEREPTEFLKLIRLLVGGGILELPEQPIPAPAQPHA